ncbi:hypothetical protein [Actinomadura sp. 3N407]|uniref:hypothetical protein n=1 Tax=Actinomadura sp. 3N407 TaxID=3457423 RepID=UPI003FCD4553
MRFHLERGPGRGRGQQLGDTDKLVNGRNPGIGHGIGLACDGIALHRLTGHRNRRRIGNRKRRWNRRRIRDGDGDGNRHRDR